MPKSDPRSIETARALLNAKERILAAWEKRVRAKVDEAAQLEHPILIDTLPAFLDVLAAALAGESAVAESSDLSDVAQEHGGERARLTNFDPKEIAIEYALLRETVIETLENDLGGELARKDRHVIQDLTDMGIREAITAFVLVQTNIREQFISTLSHDLRNPLSIIVMATDLLPDELDNKAASLELIVRIRENANRANRLISDLLDTTLIRSGGRLDVVCEPNDMADIVRESVRHQSLLHGDRFRVHGVSVQGFWDRDKLRRAIDNLLSNAIKYGEPRAPVRIEVETKHGRVVVSVHNQGDPIPPDEQEMIFQAFRRAKLAKDGMMGGWGLGLSLVRGVAEAHGGSIGVQSTSEKGTTFTIDVPLDARPFAGKPVLR